MSFYVIHGSPSLKGSEIKASKMGWACSQWGKRPLVRPTREWGDNIKIDLRNMGFDDANLA